jgi:transcriptional regulator with XRE-family HTH domain
MPPRIGPKKPTRVYLALWRDAAGLTQDQLGQRIHPPVDKGTVSKWENAEPGRLSLGVIAAFAEAIGKEALDMYRRPEEGPSLDAAAIGLPQDVRENLYDMAIAYQRRR